eukprot:227064-Rhodomonas_salina.4
MALPGKPRRFAVGSAEAATGALWAYTTARRCPRMVLSAFAMSGTDIAYGAARLVPGRAVSAQVEGLSRGGWPGAPPFGCTAAVFGGTAAVLGCIASYAAISSGNAAVFGSTDTEYTAVYGCARAGFGCTAAVYGFIAAVHGSSDAGSGRGVAIWGGRASQSRCDQPATNGTAVTLQRDFQNRVSCLRTDMLTWACGAANASTDTGVWCYECKY